MAAIEYQGRRQEVYFLSPEERSIWLEEARATGMTLSGYVLEMARLGREKEAARPKGVSPGEVSELKEKNRKLEDELRRTSLVLERYETELYKLRHETFSRPVLEGRFQAGELKAVLQKGKTLSSQELLEALRIDPRDSDAVRIVSRQLDLLQGLGLIEEVARGWRWIS